MVVISDIQGKHLHQVLTGHVVDDDYDQEWHSGREIHFYMGHAVVGEDVRSWNGFVVDLNHVVALRDYLNHVIKMEDLE